MEEAHTSFPSYISPSSSRPRLRKLATLPSWLYCFLTYVSVLSTDPVVRDRLTYARLIIREALRHGGRGWLDYDRLFRQQAALDSGIAWNATNTSLLVATVLGQHPAGVGQSCAVCHGFDHSQAQCALQVVQQPLHQESATRPPVKSRVSQEICLSWNGGQCAFPPLSCPHLCASCGSTHHRARDCRDTPLTPASVDGPQGRPDHPHIRLFTPPVVESFSRLGPFEFFVVPHHYILLCVIVYYPASLCIILFLD